MTLNLTPEEETYTTWLKFSKQTLKGQQLFLPKKEEGKYARKMKIKIGVNKIGQEGVRKNKTPGKNYS